MAVSIDGKTTGKDDDVSWVTDSDVERMDDFMMQCGVMVMGSKTYESFGEDLPNDKALQVVLTKQDKLLKKKINNVIFTDKEPKEVLSMLEEMGFKQAVLAGGEKLNTSFLGSNLIDEIRLICKPIILGEGKSLFSRSFNKKLSLIKQIDLSNDSRELHYAVDHTK